MLNQESPRVPFSVPFSIRILCKNMQAAPLSPSCNGGWIWPFRHSAGSSDLNRSSVTGCLGDPHTHCMMIFIILIVIQYVKSLFAFSPFLSFFFVLIFSLLHLHNYAGNDDKWTFRKRNKDKSILHRVCASVCSLYCPFFALKRAYQTEHTLFHCLVITTHTHTHTYWLCVSIKGVPTVLVCTFLPSYTHTRTHTLDKDMPYF